MQSSKSPGLPPSRGARFLDLVKQNKINVSPQLTKRFSDAKTNLEDDKDYLTLSSQVKHNPDASPVSSILSKRKTDTLITTPDSPFGSSAKRKRVGFRDPVSSTKEYFITEEEERLKSNSLIRCLRYDTENAEEDADELEINKENIIKLEIDNPIQEEYNVPQSTSDESVDDNKLSFKNKAELLEYVSKNLTVDELFKKLTEAEERTAKRKELVRKILSTIGFSDLLYEYFSLECQSTRLTNEQNALISQISILMAENKNFKYKLLDVLTQQHGDPVLDHVIQMNSNSTVCDKIGFTNIVSHVIHKVNTADNDDNNVLITEMNRTLIRRLIEETQATGSAIISDRETIQELMFLLFKHKPKMEIFDTVQAFIRKLLENH